MCLAIAMLSVTEDHLCYYKRKQNLYHLDEETQQTPCMITCRTAGLARSKHLTCVLRILSIVLQCGSAHDNVSSVVVQWKRETLPTYKQSLRLRPCDLRA